MSGSGSAAVAAAKKTSTTTATNAAGTVGSGAAGSSNKAQKSFREIYDEACVSLRVRPNSKLQEVLPSRPGVPVISATSSGEVVWDLSQNYVGDRGLLAVLEVVQRWSSLQRLIVTENGLRNNAIKALCAVASKHMSLTAIDVSDNYISEGAGKALEALLKQNQKIIELGFTNTKLDVDCRLRLKDQLALNNAAGARGAGKRF